MSLRLGWGLAGAAAMVVLVCVDVFNLQATKSIEALGEPLTHSEPG